jgi:hypothetical protein
MIPGNIHGSREEPYQKRPYYFLVLRINKRVLSIHHVIVFILSRAHPAYPHPNCCNALMRIALF